MMLFPIPHRCIADMTGTHPHCLRRYGSRALVTVIRMIYSRALLAIFWMIYIKHFSLYHDLKIAFIEDGSLITFVEGEENIPIYLMSFLPSLSFM